MLPTSQGYWRAMNERKRDRKSNDRSSLGSNYVSHDVLKIWITFNKENGAFG